jgi:hypothetical protein
LFNLVKKYIKGRLSLVDVVNYLIQNTVDREMIEITPQNNFNTFEYGYKIGKMIQISRNNQFEGKKKILEMDSNDIFEYGENAKKSIDSEYSIVTKTNPNTPIPTPKQKQGIQQQQSQPKGKSALQKELERRKEMKAGGSVVGFLEPKHTKYDENKKIKIFDIRKENFMDQIFIKSEQILIKKQRIKRVIRKAKCCK